MCGKVNEMSNRITIVMYHYVRELKHARYPEIKGLAAEDFKEQIDYITKHYNVLSATDVMNIIESGSDFPPRALLLTFDDGYIDHFIHVFPVLDQKKIPGCFFPPAKCVLEGEVLDVNKIHFVLASVEDKGELVAEINRALDRYRPTYDLDTKEQYWRRLGKPSRFDSAEVRFVKKMLQRELPESLRRVIVDALFKRYVTRDEKAFSKELYMTLDQITCLQRNRMYIGSHSIDHLWLNTLTEHEQEREIDLSLQFLHRIGSDTARWIMCYPYGAFNDSLLSILKRRSCKVGLTTHVGIADLRRDQVLTLPRLDTNDLPRDANAVPNTWTQQIMG